MGDATIGTAAASGGGGVGVMVPLSRMFACQKKKTLHPGCTLRKPAGALCEEGGAGCACGVSVMTAAALPLVASAAAPAGKDVAHEEQKSGSMLEDSLRWKRVLAVLDTRRLVEEELVTFIKGVDPVPAEASHIPADVIGQIKDGRRVYACKKCDYINDHAYHARMHFTRVHIRGGKPHVVVLEAGLDSLDFDEDLPLAPWL